MTEKELRPLMNVVACAGKKRTMIVPVKMLAVLAGMCLIGNIQARIWTNDRGVTLVGVLMSVRDTDVDLKLQDGRIVAVPKKIFSGADQSYIQEWVKSGGTLPDTDVGAENSTVQSGSSGYIPLAPNWDAPWPSSVESDIFLLIQTVQETDELSVYESDHFIIESPDKLSEKERQTLVLRFESILSALASVPLNLTVARHPSRKYLVRVCFLEEEFEKMPGLRNGNMKFSPTSFTVLLQRDQKGRPQRLSAINPGFAVAHWVAQSMDLDHWLVDGLAMYMSFLPREKETLILRKIPEKLAAKLPRAIRFGKTELPALKDLLARDSVHSLTEHNNSEFEDRSSAEWADLLWAVYWFHLEGEGKATRIRQYLKTREEVGSNSKSLSVLLDGKTVEEVQGEMAQAWLKQGVRLKFAPPSGDLPVGKKAKDGEK